MKKLFILIFFYISTFTHGQVLKKNWGFVSIENISGETITKTSNTDSFNLNKKGEFNYTITSAPNESFKASGNYLHQNNLLIFKFNQPKDTIRYYNIVKLTDSNLILSENNTIYRFTSEVPTPQIKETKIISSSNKNKLIKSKGFTFNSFWRGLLGITSLLIITFLFSTNRKAIHWKTVGLGIGFQLFIAITILKGKDIGFNIGKTRFDLGFITNIFDLIGVGFVKILNFSQAGSEFLFQGLVSDMDSFGFIFAFQVLPTIIFFSALTSLLFYLGLIQKLVKVLAWSLSKILKISGAESLSVAGNIFLGQTEAPLLIKAYLEKMNKSEMLLVMIGGMATVAGAVLAAYIGFLGGNDEVLRLLYAKHLLAASVMAAPGAIVISKILYPQTENVNTNLNVSQKKIGSNLLDAITNGTTEGLHLAMNVGAMLLVFVAFIALLNGILDTFGSFNGIAYLNWEFISLNELITSSTIYEGLSLEFILGYLFSPLMLLIGVAKEDMSLMGQLLGIKLAASEFVAYIQLAELKNVVSTIHLTYNKSVIMATYMLCGFANFASIGIQIGGIGSLAPKQRKTLTEFGIKALIGGTIASLMSATIAGMILG